MNTYICKVNDTSNPWHNEYFVVVASNEAEAKAKAETFLGQGSVIMVAQARAII